MRKVRRERTTRIPRNFIVYAMMSIMLIVLLKIISSNLRPPVVTVSSEQNLRMLARAIAKYAIEHDSSIPKKLSALYPEYCDNLGAYNAAGAIMIAVSEDIDRRSFFKLNPELPEKLEEIHLRSALILVIDTSIRRGASHQFIINGNLEVFALTAESKSILGLTYKEGNFIREEIDENVDGKVDEEQFSLDGAPVYSIKKTYSKEGKLFREIWYDENGELTSDYGPAFRMYNYDMTGKLAMISNHYAKGESAECFGVAKITYKYNSKGVIENYFRKDGSLITVIERPANP